MTRRAAVLLAAAATIAAVAAAALPHERSEDREVDRDPTLYGIWVELDEAAAHSDLPPIAGTPPVNPQLVATIAATGARVRYVSRWLRAVSVDADSATIARLAALPGVTGMRPIADLVPAAGAAGPRAAGPPAAGAEGAAAAAGAPAVSPAYSPAASPDVSPEYSPAHSTAVSTAVSPDSSFYGATWSALRELNIPILHDLGFTGSTSRIAILDTGFSLEHETLKGRTIAAARDFIHGDAFVDRQPGDPVDVNQEQHGTWVFSLLGGYAPGRLVGGAYNAIFYLAKVDLAGRDTQGDEDRWVAGVEWADSVGARIINSSVGFRANFIDKPPIPYGQLDGNTTMVTRMADEAARRGIIFVQAIGNAGPAAGTLWAPADADSIIVVGSMDSLVHNPMPVAVPSNFSSRGPTADGRMKPDVVARGANLIAAAAGLPNSYERGVSGSSVATPFITAGAALFNEAWPNISPIGVRDALRLAGTAARAPNNAVGFGAPDIAAAIMFPQGLLLSSSSLGPTDLNGRLTSILPRFRWDAPLIHPVMRPIVYRVQVARDSLFQDIVLSDTVTESFLYTAREPLPPMNRAWWRVIATSPQGVRRTATAPGPFTVPQWVRQLTLAADTTEFLRELRPELSWAPLSAPAPVGPFTYEVQVLSVPGAVLQRIPNLTTTSVRVPEPLSPNAAYRWRVIARTQTGVADTVETSVPFVVVSDEAPPATILYQNFPNPFPERGFGRHSTRIWFDLASTATVELAVYDLRGRLVKQLIPAFRGCGDVRLRAGLYGRSGGNPAGDFNPQCVLVEWDATNHRGERVPRGVYILRLRAGDVQDSRRMLYIGQ